jgi:hypothetical protein
VLTFSVRCFTYTFCRYAKGIFFFAASLLVHFIVLVAWLTPSTRPTSSPAALIASPILLRVLSSNQSEFKQASTEQTNNSVSTALTAGKDSAQPPITSIPGTERTSKPEVFPRPTPEMQSLGVMTTQYMPPDEVDQTAYPLAPFEIDIQSFQPNQVLFVPLRIYLSQSGKVDHIELFGPPSQLTAEQISAVLSGIRTTPFSPAMKNDQPVSSSLAIEVAVDTRLSPILMPGSPAARPSPVR